MLRNNWSTKCKDGKNKARSKKFWDDGWTVITFSRSEVAPQCPWSNNKQFHFQVDLENTNNLI